MKIVPARPDKKWTDDEIKKFESWMKEKWGPGLLCSQCNVSDWIVSEWQAVVPGQSIFGDIAFPCVVVVCQNCGNTVLVNAIVCGLRASDEEAKKDG